MSFNHRIKISKADRLFSLYVRHRAKWTCERCGKIYKPPTNVLQCSHFHGRAKLPTRWEPDNAAALCFGCHDYMTSQPAEHTDFFARRLGEKRFTSLYAQANLKKTTDEKLIEIWLSAELKKFTKVKKA